MVAMVSVILVEMETKLDLEKEMVKVKDYLRMAFVVAIHTVRCFLRSFPLQIVPDMKGSIH